MGGINAIAAGSAMPPGDCIQAYNLFAGQFGLQTRSGSREWCTGLTGALDNQVRTVVSFTGSAANGAQNRVFACTSTGIWDVTSSSDEPSQVFSFPVQTGEAGHGVAHAVVTLAGHFLAYCDEENGLIVYSQTSGTWSAVTLGADPATQISGVDPSTFVFCTVFKGRLWFVPRDSADLWYLDPGALFGTANRFGLGTKLRAGGPLVGIWNWTIDGGSGIDDRLVAISGGGDVVVYGGTDPSSASTFGIQGVWYAGGAPPAGRNIATNFGGDMLILTRVGIVPLSRLMAGVQLENTQYSTHKIGPVFNQLMLTRATQRGWSMRLHPEDNTLVVTVPEGVGQPTSQIAMSLANRSWYRYRDLPIFSSEAHGGKLYFGTVDGKVCINDGTVDGVTLADPSAATAIQWSSLGAFSNLGNGRQKRVQMIRPTLLSENVNPAFEVAARYRFDMTELATVTADTEGGWGTAAWDVDVWGAEYGSLQVVRGATGMGTDVAIAIRGAAVARTILVGYDVLFDQGGLL